MTSTSDIKSTIKARIRKLEQISALADDPETESLLRELFGSNGNGSKPAPIKTAEPPIRTPDEQNSVPPPPINGNGNGRGQLKKMVFQVLEDAPGPLTTETVASLMESEGFRFTSQRPTVAVNEALNAWQREGLAQVHHTEGRTQFWVKSPVQGDSAGNE
jgi:hypothetical protein